MPKPRKNPIIQCTHFPWRLYARDRVYYADGRSKKYALGRHSLGTRNHDVALELLRQLDRQKAIDLGLIVGEMPQPIATVSLPLLIGRQLYEERLRRPRVSGGVQPSTQKRYRTVFDKFLAWCEGRNITCWDMITASDLLNYATYLSEGGEREKPYAEKSLSNELTTIKQARNWLIAAGHLRNQKPIALALKKAHSQRAYCWTQDEVNAIVLHCQAAPELRWLANVVVGLAFTGLRISELSSLRWSDVDLHRDMISLNNDRGRSLKTSASARQLPIHAQLKEVLTALPLRKGTVFLGPRGGRIKPDYARTCLFGKVLKPLAKRFPHAPDEQGFADGRLHSFRHYFASTCANNSVPEQMLMSWLGHENSEMVRYYYHLHDAEAQRRMQSISFLGNLQGVPSGSSDTVSQGAEDEECARGA